MLRPSLAPTFLQFIRFPLILPVPQYRHTSQRHCTPLHSIALLHIPSSVYRYNPRPTKRLFLANNLVSLIIHPTCVRKSSVHLAPSIWKLSTFNPSLATSTLCRPHLFTVLLSKHCKMQKTNFRERPNLYHYTNLHVRPNSVMETSADHGKYCTCGMVVSLSLDIGRSNITTLAVIN